MLQLSESTHLIPILTPLYPHINFRQLCHPLVSPVLQGSLGNLPPLYIIAGEGEVLRDEIVYTAHKAAHPAQYPARKGVLREGRRQKENAEKFTTPTKVKYLFVNAVSCNNVGEGPSPSV